MMCIVYDQDGKMKRAELNRARAAENVRILENRKPFCSSEQLAVIDETEEIVK